MSAVQRARAAYEAALAEHGAAQREANETLIKMRTSKPPKGADHLWDVHVAACGAEHAAKHRVIAAGLALAQAVLDACHARPSEWTVIGDLDELSVCPADPHLPDVDASAADWAMKPVETLIGTRKGLEVASLHLGSVHVGDGATTGAARIEDTAHPGPAEILSLIGFLLQSLDDAPMPAALRRDYEAVVAAYRTMAARDGYRRDLSQMATVAL